MATRASSYYADSAVPLGRSQSTRTEQRQDPRSVRRTSHGSGVPTQNGSRSSQPSRSGREPRPNWDDSSDRAFAYEQYEDDDGNGVVAEIVSRSQGVMRTLLHKTGVEKRRNSQRAEALHDELLTPVKNGVVAVFARKGGVGKTAISAYLGLTLAQARVGRVLTVDADADSGSLGWMLAPEVRPMLNTLVSSPRHPQQLRDFRPFVERVPEGVDVIACEPFEGGELVTDRLASAVQSMRDAYAFSVLDIGAAVATPVGDAMLSAAGVGVLVVGSSIDGVRAAERTLSWLAKRERESGRKLPIIAVLNGVSDEVDTKELMRIENLFASRCDAFVEIPWDPHLSSGSPVVSLDELTKPTQLAFLELAAAIVGVSRSRRAGSSHGGDRSHAALR